MVGTLCSDEIVSGKLDLNMAMIICIAYAGKRSGH